MAVSATIPMQGLLNVIIYSKKFKTIRSLFGKYIFCCCTACRTNKVVDESADASPQVAMNLEHGAQNRHVSNPQTAEETDGHSSETREAEVLHIDENEAASRYFLGIET